MPKNEPNRETPLIEVKDIAKEFSLKKVFIKDESVNSYGSIKDRRNISIITEAGRLKIEKLVLITSGNNGYSLAKLSEGTDIKVVCIVDRDLSPESKIALSKVAYHVIELNLKHKILRPEELIAFAREREDEVIWDVTNGYEDSYGAIVDEILSKTSPTHIVVPVGSGGIYTGLIRALEHRDSKTKVVGIGVQNTQYSLADKLYTPWTPYAKALDHYETMGHHMYRLSEDEIRKNHNRFKQYMTCEPSSSIVFAALQKHSFNPSDVVVFVNSGKTAI
jgi:cysteine synthase